MNGYVFRELGMLYLNEKRDFEMARRMFARSLELNPNQPDLAILINQPPSPDDLGPDLPGIEPPIPQLPDLGIELPVPQIPKPPEIPQLPK